MAMVRISDKAFERLKALAAEGNRPMTNQLDVLLLTPKEKLEQVFVDAGAVDNRPKPKRQAKFGTEKFK